MNPTPAIKANALLNVIQRLSHERKPSQLELARVQREATTLIRSGAAPSDGHMMLGIVCAFQNDTDEFQRHFQIAFGLSSDRYIRKNYIFAALRLGLVEQPLAQARDLFQMYPDDIGALRLAHEMAMRALDFDLAERAEHALRKLEAWRTEEVITLARMRPVRERASRLRISTSDIVARLDVAAKTVRDAGEPVFGLVFDFGREGRVSYGIVLRASVDVLCDINFRIVDRLVDQFDDTLADLFTICCLTRPSELHTPGLSLVSDQTQQ